MNMQFFITRFRANAEAFERMLRGMDGEHATWTPEPGKWSVRDVVCHLVDEERFDFRVRLDYTLHKPGEAWPGFDPIAWVTEHDYAGKNLDEQLRVFLAERAKSIEWLGTLADPDLSMSYRHARLGVITAGSMLGSWLAHDYLHMRQISRLNYQYLAQWVAPHELNYAGPWNPNG
jgi:hypothetical protein